MKAIRLQKFAAVLVPIFLGGAVLFAWGAAFRNSPREIPILMYHRISDCGSKWCVPPEVFEDQMSFLREEGYVSILPGDLVANRRWGKPLPDRPVIITFDDGYLDVITEVEPVLAKYGLRGIVYLITDYVADRPEERKQFAGADCLTWPEVRGISRRGVLAFGGHSCSHASLVRQPACRREPSGCSAAIERSAGFRVEDFCYPHGQCNQETVTSVRGAGFRTGVTSENRVAAWGPEADLYRLPRVSVMGGRNSFSLERRIVPGSLEPVFGLGYQGVDMEVSSALRLPGVDGEPLWHAPLELRPGGEYLLHWPVPEGAETGPFQVEIWDKNRILRLHAEEFD